MTERTFLYLDHGATSWPKPASVLKAMEQAMKTGANPGRGLYAMARDTDRKILKARRDIARFFGMSDRNAVIFTSGATDALTTVFRGKMTRDSRILIGPYEHNAVYRTAMAMAPEHLQIVRGDGRFGWDMEDFRKKCRAGIDYAVVSHVSNVTGVAAPLSEIEREVHDAGALLILDASQSAGIIPINMQRQGIDFLCTSGHKGLLGPMGVGLLLMEPAVSGCERCEIAPLRIGGTGMFSDDLDMPLEYPWRLEAGTMNVPGISGLHAGIQYLQEIGVEKVGRREQALATLAMNAMRNIPLVEIYGRTEESVLFSFGIEGKTPEIVAHLLSEYCNVAVRAGLHCAPLAHRNLGTTPQGTVRIGFGWNHTEEDVEQWLTALQFVTEMKGRI